MKCCKTCEHMKMWSGIRGRKYRCECTKYKFPFSKEYEVKKEDALKYAEGSVCDSYEEKVDKSNELLKKINFRRIK